ncbi:MAG TPA: DUF1893 domain-containing protein [Firmicutes bacterium]|nr:DUF1893 domain-containing protein [Bacillota bacterium]
MTSSRDSHIMDDPDIRVVAEAISSGACTVALARDGAVFVRTAGEGLRPLLEALSRHPAAVRGAVLGDRVVGKAAALLAAEAGVRAVWALIMSEAANDVLQQSGIPGFARSLVPFVAGRDPRQLCPLEQLVQAVHDPAVGGRLLRAALGLGIPDWVQDIRGRLEGSPLLRRIGRVLMGHECVSSTNDVARDLGLSGYPEGTVVLARQQTAGRGRLGRRWVSPAGGIWMSVLLRPSSGSGAVPSRSFQGAGAALPGLSRGAGGVLLVLGSLATVQALAQVVGLEAGIKWPNDVYWQGRKLGGILAEAAADLSFVVLGIGLNVDFPLSALPPAEQEAAITVQEALCLQAQARWGGGGTDRGQREGEDLVAALAAAIIDCMEDLYARARAEGVEPLLDRWREKCLMLGKKVLVKQSDRCWEGTAQDIDREGALLVRGDKGGLVRVVAGDVSLRLEG